MTTAAAASAVAEMTPVSLSDSRRERWLARASAAAVALGVMPPPAPLSLSDTRLPSLEGEIQGDGLGEATTGTLTLTDTGVGCPGPALPVEEAEPLLSLRADVSTVGAAGVACAVLAAGPAGLWLRRAASWSMGVPLGRLEGAPETCTDKEMWEGADTSELWDCRRCLAAWEPGAAAAAPPAMFWADPDDVGLMSVSDANGCSRLRWLASRKFSSSS